MSALEGWKAQRGTGHNYATPALADAAIAELEAGNQALMEMCNNCERLEKAEAELTATSKTLSREAQSVTAFMTHQDSYNKELRDLRKERDDTRAELAELKAQVTFKDKAIDGFHAELAALQDGISRRIEQEVAADTADLLAKLAGLEFQRDALLEELDDLKARNCGTCLFSEICLAHVDSTEGLFPVESCSRWTPQP